VPFASDTALTSPEFDLLGDHPLTVDKLMIAALHDAGSLKDIPGEIPLWAPPLRDIFYAFR
jgi:hypothetical protein